MNYYDILIKLFIGIEICMQILDSGCSFEKELTTCIFFANKYHMRIGYTGTADMREVSEVRYAVSPKNMRHA